MAQGIAAAIFDVDGVLVDSPHEQAWREALAPFADPAGFTTRFYQSNVAGRARLEGARATLEKLGGPGAAAQAEDYAAAKQAIIDQLTSHGEFDDFPDAVRLAAALHSSGLKLALASSSKNAAAMLRKLPLPDGLSLHQIFDADLSGRDVPRGKPDPALFLLAAEALGVPPSQCVVIEDAPAGIQAARAAGMASLGVARLGDEALLRAAGADLVVTSLDQADVAGLLAGEVRARSPGAGLRMQEAFEPTRGPGWVLTHRGYNVLTESGVESRLALGNGFIGMRAARSVSRAPTWLSWLGHLRWASWPRCYVAGLFDVPNTEPPVPALVPVADWSRVRIVLDGQALLAREGDILRSARQLDMRRGLLVSGWTQRTPVGITATGRELRLLSQADRAAGLQLLQFALDRDGVDVRFEASFALAGVGMEPVQLDQDLGVWRTQGTQRDVSMAGAACLRVDGEVLTPERPFPLRWVWRWRSVAGQVAEFDRLISVATSMGPSEDPGPAAEDARSALARNQRIGWRAALDDHEDAWAARWRAADIVIEGDPDLQRAIRFAVYHLVSTANPEDETVSVGARALTGDAYLGHVFWDTEVYLLPFYIATWPEAARAMLMYRFHTLPAARAKAAAAGYKGALYAWESADSGVETTPDRVVGPDGSLVDVLCGKLEQHISADVAYAVWRYWRATEDRDFLLAAGAEIILETARFWASRAAPEADGGRHIRHVIGPDEYHEDVDDSAFTNAMARWNIARGLEVVELLRALWPEHAAALQARLALDANELADWRDAVDLIVTGRDPDTGLYEQFAGFHALERLDLSEFAERTVPIDVVIGRERTQRSQVVKQADVVALIAMLPELFPGGAAETNFRHYEPICGHGSSLSPAMHALVAARLGHTELALQYLHGITQFDPDPGAAGGVRIAGLGGIWQAVVVGFAGLDFGGDLLGIDPKLPRRWRSLSFRVGWRGRSIAFRISGRHVHASLVRGEAVDLRIGELQPTLAPGSDVDVILPQAAISEPSAHSTP
jgi:HAD superfamily hydrolase (TIGR01509 family)